MKRQSFFIAALLILLGLCFYFEKTASRKPMEGEQYTYTYHADGLGYSDVEQLYTSDTIDSKRPFFKRASLQMISFSLDCRIKKTIVDKDDDRQLTYYEIIDPVLKITNNDAPFDAEAIRKEMTRPFFAESNGYGNIDSVRIDTSVSYLPATFMKDIISRLQFIKPITLNRKWQVEEENTTGTFTAAYQWVSDSSHLSAYEKTNKGYTRFKSMQKNEKILTDSKIILWIDSSNTVHKIAGSESQVTLFDKDTIAASGNRISISLQSESTATKDELIVFQKTMRQTNYQRATTLSAALSEEEINKLAYKNTLGNDTWEALTARLNATGTHPANEEDELTMKFRSLCYLYPQYCEKMTAILKTEMPGSFKFNVLSHALAIVGTTDATNALVGLIQSEKKNESLLIELLPALATTSRPTEKASALLKELAFETEQPEAVRSTAQLALGGVAYNYRRTDIAKADKITHYLVNKMNNTTDTLQKLLVLGNTGSPLITPILQTFITNKKVSGQWRAAAINAFRLVKHEEASQLLTAMVRDKDTLVSKAAKETIQFRLDFDDNKRR